MKSISTSKLASKLGLNSKELFHKLSSKNWIYKNEDGWQLTKDGRLAGGEMARSDRFGEFIVWPENLNIHKEVTASDLLNATKIGESFKISSRKINLYFHDLGWIDKDRGGWVLTNQGKNNGGVQMEAMNGAPYVLWHEKILQNKHLLREIGEAKGDSEILHQEAVELDADDFRKRFPATHRTPDGHLVRSRAELLIDDFLYKNGIVHAYERKLNIDEPLYCDFYLPMEKVYIEFWGMDEDTQYAERKKKKQEIYAKYGFKLIELNDSDIRNLDERLSAKLRKFNIVVD